MRRLGAIGTLVWDTNWHPSVVTPAGAPLEQWGGVVYSLAALSAACPRGWVVEPIVKVGADLEGAARRQLASLPNLAVGAGVRTVPEPNNRVELRYHDRAERGERLTGGVPGWSWPELEPLVRPLAALYVNFLSGFELDLAATRRLRAGFPGLLHGDLHSLFLGPPGAGARPPRPLPRWEEWVAAFDVVQLNEPELSLLAGGADPETVLPRMIDLGAKVVVVTLGGRGVRFVARGDLPPDPVEWPRLPPASGPLRAGHVAAPLGELPGDPTGCGDVWGAAFVAGLLDGLPLETAASRAQRLAAAKIAHPDTATLHRRLAAVAREPALPS